MQQANEPNAPHDANTEQRRGRAGIIFLAASALIIAIISLVFQFFFWQLHQKNQENLKAQNQELMQTVLPKFQGLNAELNKQQQVLNNLMAKTQAEDKKSAIYAAKEVEYLLTFAQYSLLYDDNVEFASKLLNDGLQKINGIPDPALMPLRKSLEQDLSTLSATPRVDMTDLLGRIASISDQVSALSPIPVMTNNVINKPVVQPQTSWKEKLLDVVRSLRGLVTIRRLEEPIKPLVSPEQQLSIVEDIRLQLLKAQWGLLHQNQTVYRLGLEHAIKQLQSYYLRSPNGEKLIQALLELYQINIKPNMPDLNNSIQLLRTYVHDSEQNVSTLTNKPVTPDFTGTTNDPALRALPS